MDGKNFEQFQLINEKAIDTSNAVIKTGLLINGGATVAVLSFVAAIASNNGKYSAMIVGVSDALMLFSYGVIAAVIASALAYFTHFSLLAYLNAKVENKRRAVSAWKWGKRLLHVSAILAVLASVVLFGFGAHEVKKAIVDGAASSAADIDVSN